MYTRLVRVEESLKRLRNERSEEEWLRIEENGRVMQNVRTRRRTRGIVDVAIGDEMKQFKRLKALEMELDDLIPIARRELLDKAYHWIWLATNHLPLSKDMIRLVVNEIIKF